MPIRDERLKRMYLDENVTCELSAWLRCCRHSVGVDPHHILGGPFRDDVTSNLVAVCRSGAVSLGQVDEEGTRLGALGRPTRRLPSGVDRVATDQGAGAVRWPRHHIAGANVAC